jgi:hypothetical protein
MMEVLGYIMVFIGGALLHEVPFPRFITALMLIIIGLGLVIIK